MTAGRTLAAIGRQSIPDVLKPALLRVWYRLHNRSLRIGSGVRLDAHCEFGEGVRLGVGVWAGHSSVGDYSYLARGASLFYAHLGKYCSIGDEAMVGLARHPSCGYISTYPAFFSGSNEAVTVRYCDVSQFDETPLTVVGSDVWIGARATIRGGICVGHGAIVGAGAVVTRNVPDYAVVAGVPARLLRRRFSDEEVRLLLDAQWWDWSRAKLKSLAPLFGDPEEFFAMLARGEVS